MAPIRLILVSTLISFTAIENTNAEDRWKANAFVANGTTCSSKGGEFFQEYDGTPFPSKDDENQDLSDCEDGDMTLFNGILCASGEAAGCDAVRNSRTADGRMWRSPRRAQTNNLGTGDSGGAKAFSPDMQLGVLLYAIERNDTDLLQNWFRWLSDNRPCLLENPAGGCLYRGLPRYCIATECTMRPIDRDIDAAVYSWLVGTPPDGINNYNDIVVEITAFPLFFVLPFELIYLNIPVGEKVYREAQLNGPGYPRHVNAVRAWILNKINHADAPRARDALALIASQEPNNAFFQYLHEGPTPRVRELITSYCPTAEQASQSTRFEWMWEQGNSASWSRPYRDGAGNISAALWDCIALRNLVGDATLGHGASIREMAAVNIALNLLSENEIPIGKTPQTLEFAPLVDSFLGENAPSLVLHASSGLPVELESGTPNVCTVGINGLRLIAIGTCELTASQSGNSSYASATPIMRSFSVLAMRSIQNIDFTAPSMMNAGSQSELVASATSGLIVSFQSITPSICTVLGNTVVSLNTGTCTVEASQAGDERYLPANIVTQNVQIGVSQGGSGNDDGDVPLPGWALATLGAALVRFALKNA
ncbi:hypothetical protein NMQ14_04530 [Methyloversatilis sp. XJ19-13]|uniref:hypothetical protein n=1 Tax=Methyloversatilis sp. XJ19-13 TaxID=2963430 RepID=UPI00211BE0A6|nr:hypothetical protein [Methyloversatilis sp. XJ19-13]MCQ9373508.1 hypothetical protein [Methyloversatilis sp. XJ19-13]